MTPQKYYVSQKKTILRIVENFKFCWIKFFEKGPNWHQLILPLLFDSLKVSVKVIVDNNNKYPKQTKELSPNYSRIKPNFSISILFIRITFPFYYIQHLKEKSFEGRPRVIYKTLFVFMCYRLQSRILAELCPI